VRLLTREQLASAYYARDELLTLREVSARLDVDVSTVDWWVRSGWVGVLHVGGRRHVLLSEASDVEHAKRTQPGPKRPRNRDKTTRRPQESQRCGSEVYSKP
jgi:hypothetical protein